MHHGYWEQPSLWYTISNTQEEFKGIPFHHSKFNMPNCTHQLCWNYLNIKIFKQCFWLKISDHMMHHMVLTIYFDFRLDNPGITGNEHAPDTQSSMTTRQFSGMIKNLINKGLVVFSCTIAHCLSRYFDFQISDDVLLVSTLNGGMPPTSQVGFLS